MNAVALSNCSARNSFVEKVFDFARFLLGDFRGRFFPSVRGFFYIIKSRGAMFAENMLPASSPYRVSGSAFLNPVSLAYQGDAISTAVISAHGYDETICEYAKSIFLSGERDPDISSFSNHIENVVAVSSYPKMAGVNAFRVVALMENKKTTRDWSFMVFVTKPVGQLFPFVSKVSGISHAVSLVVKGCGPLPAAIGSTLVHFIPKTFVKHTGSMVVTNSNVNRELI